MGVVSDALTSGIGAASRSVARAGLDREINALTAKVNLGRAPARRCGMPDEEPLAAVVQRRRVDDHASLPGRDVAALLGLERCSSAQQRTVLARNDHVQAPLSHDRSFHHAAARPRCRIRQAARAQPIMMLGIEIHLQR